MTVSPPETPKLYAHSLADRNEDAWELLSDHLEQVAEAAAANAAAFAAEGWGAILGKCHDLGKGSTDFQKYLRTADRQDAQDAGVELESSSSRVDHSTYGARYVAQNVGGWPGRLLAFCIAGHHSGLANDFPTDGSERSTLRDRLNPGRPIPALEDPGIPLAAPKFPWKLGTDCNLGWSLSFFTRMLFSSLVDADRTCTEAFCEPETAAERNSPRPTLSELEIQLRTYLAGFMASTPDSEVNKWRRVVLEQCLSAATFPPGFFSLQVPTGGGKTLSSLTFALRHASVNTNLRRVIVAIPFTSIIEQTADVYRRALGPMADGALVEHHTNIQPLYDTRANQFGTENWDAPLLVTTNVQLLESLFASSTTPCRKLHRIAGSVIIFDEAQTLPVDLLTPTLSALRELVEHYGCSVVLCTATQPALEWTSEFPVGIKDVRPIIPEVAPVFSGLKRVQVQRTGKLTDQELADRLSGCEQALCIVNTRRHAARLFDRLRESMPDCCFHLSTLMCGAHRRIVLREIRERLAAGMACRIVSTQLIEAGVDLDVPVVYRAMAGFDSIAQAAGRCNREGRLPNSITYVFDPEQEPPPGLQREAAQCAKELFSMYPDPLAPEAIRAYFERFYWGRKDRWDAKGILDMLKVDRLRGETRFQFREVAAAYRIIEDSQLPILIPFDPHAQQLLTDLQCDRVEFLSHRKLQPYLVSVPEPMLRRLEASGVVCAHASGVHLLLRMDAYTQTKGLRLEGLDLDSRLWGV